MSLNCGKKVGAAGGERSTVEGSDEMFLLEEEKLQGFWGERQKCLAKRRSNGNPINCWEVGLESHNNAPTGSHNTRLDFAPVGVEETTYC